VATYLTDLPGGPDWQMVDLTLGAGPATVVEWTSTYTETGAVGAPELATAEKGRRVFDHAVERLIGLVRWVKERPIPPRQEHHAAPPTFPLPFGF
jgi:creatinine amidohydrolase/Fe(II)-dependent formamide hydrolase-like protein